MKWRLIFYCGVVLSVSGALHAGRMPEPDLGQLVTPTYSVENDAFVRHNGDRFNNRPLYCNQIAAVVLAGDKPLLRLGHRGFELGSLLFGVRRGETVKWLIDCDDITSRYIPGKMQWTVRDRAIPGMTISLEVLPAAEGPGWASEMRVDGSQPGDQIIWGCGVVTKLSQSFLNAWDVTTGGRDALLTRTLSPELATGNRIQLEASKFEITSKDDAIVRGISSSGVLKIVDAMQWRDPVSLIASNGGEHPFLLGSAEIDPAKPFYLAINGTSPSPETSWNAEGDPRSAAEFHQAAVKRFDSIRSRLEIRTPDPRLDAAMYANLVVADGVFRKGVFNHAGMRWGVPLVGWRTMHSATCFGWIDRVKQQVKYFTDNQLKESDKKTFEADSALKLTRQSPNSRLFGKGRITVHQSNHYNMQTQFFDQAIHAWRWTGDAELEAMLRPALELHLEYVRDCFDPDDDGVYESYTNTWPTDHTWFSGGGTSEETAYAFTAHRAARDLARRAGDSRGEQAHQARMEKISKGFFEKMWAKHSGHPGAVREQTGHQRLREDCWLYSIFCPIDAGMLDPVQAAQSLHYTEWALQRIQLPYGGEQVWPSNWVPSIWSVREMWPGDNYALAMAYFQTGLADDGWNVLSGTFPQYLLYGPVPGDQGHAAGATDFNDCAATFGRTVVEGLFGFSPDYPNDLVTIAPKLPKEWNDASIRTPDFSLKIARGDGETQYSIHLTQSAAMRICVPINARKISSVTVNGVAAHHNTRPGFGQSIVEIDLPNTASAEVRVLSEGSHIPASSVKTLAESGSSVALVPEGEKLVEVHDPQAALEKITGANAVVGKDAGHKLVVATIKYGDLSQWRVQRLSIRNRDAEAAEKARFVEVIPANARFETVDLSKVFNGDIRTIFKQEYLSPRPNTASLRIGTDGYSAWQMAIAPDKNKVPEIKLDRVADLAKGEKTITAMGVPFTRPADAEGAQNIAFTSLWDNWPDAVEVPVNQSGEAVWLLVCGSTFPMHTRIANARIVLNYADGSEDQLDLVPPLNFWSLCPYGGFDYEYQRDGFALPKAPPPQVQLGANCRAMVLNHRLRKGVVLKSVTLETLSPEVVIGLMGVTVMKENP